MHPILYQFPDSWPLLGGHALHAYGVMVALGFLAGLFYIKWESRRIGLPEEKILDLFFFMIVTGLLGSRILYFINSGNNFWADPLQFFRLWEGGLVFQGGVIACVFVAIWFCKRHQLGFFKTGDVFMPALALGHGFGRIGCFLAGCCFGRQCDPGFPLAVHFPYLADGIAPPAIPLYPTQLFESMGEFAVFFILLTYRKRKPFDGAVFLLYIVLYAILRSVLEVFRGDSIRGFVIEPYLSRGQFISLLSLIAAAVMWGILKKRARRA
jgi:phosphatidylglycerol:prolipoprotein diacylglycerol transferase